MNKDAKHKASMEKQKTNVDASIAAADTDKSLVVLLTGNGKGKTSSAFGMVMRAMGYGQRVGIVQFIKGEQLSFRTQKLQRTSCAQTLGSSGESSIRGLSRPLSSASWVTPRA